MLAEDREHDASQLRIAGRGPAAAGAGAAEGRLVLGRVGETQGRAVEPEHGQAAPARGLRGRPRPHARRAAEQRGQRGGPEPVAGAHDGAVRDAAARAARRRQHEIEMLDHLRDRAIEEQRHPDDEPDDVLGGKFPPPQRRLARGREGVGDPFGIDRFLELFETRRALTGAHGHDRLAHPHRPTSRGANHVLPAGKEIQNPVTYALSDWHCC